MTRHLRRKRVPISFVLAVLVAGLAAAMPVEAAFPGANGKIAFSSSSRMVGVGNLEGDLEIFAVKPDGSELEQITRNDVSDDDPAYSPDGAEIVFERNADLYRMNADGSEGEVRLTDTPEVQELAPAWSPDGEKIVFARGFADDIKLRRSEIYKMDALDGSDVVRLTGSRDAIERSPVWSPDGKKITFSANGKTVGAGIYKINASDGSARTRLTGSGLAAYQPDWSPDGRKIAFYGSPNRRGSSPADIYKMKADGSGVMRLTEDPAFDFSPAWSPDGDEITFDSARDHETNGSSIFKMNADGSDETAVTDNLASDSEPDWQPVPVP